MKCLCCNEKFQNAESLKKHYVEYHGVDEENYFYKRLFSRDRFFFPRKCFRCEHLCTSDREEKVHNFLSHYQQRGWPFEEDNFRCELAEVRINFADHSDFYSFYNSREIISKYLNVFENIFLPQSNFTPVKFECSFTTIPRQPSSMHGFVETIDTRVCVHDVYEGVYFNDFMKAGIGNDIKKMIYTAGWLGVAGDLNALTVFALVSIENISNQLVNRKK